MQSNSFEWPRRQEESQTKLFEIVSPEPGGYPFLQDFSVGTIVRCFAVRRTAGLVALALRATGGGRQAEPLVLSDEMGFRRGVYGCSKIFLVLSLKRKNGCLKHQRINNRMVNETKKVFVPGGEQAPFFDFESSETVILDRFTQISER
ncbi:hypothetical protein [Rikenella microfusus]|uniref:hypothetical protein n=1 Tax=Rikenella microfusus TaxID=28139 RepID=UPI00248F41F8|nr:hypothetical protein [Rikenella microfusus]